MGLDHPDLAELRERDRLQDIEMSTLNPRVKRRLILYVIGSVITFPLITWFFTPAGFGALWFQIPISAAYGAFVALTRPTGLTAAGVTMLTGLGILYMANPKIHPVVFVITVIVYAMIGGIVAVSERSKIMTGIR